MIVYPYLDRIASPGDLRAMAARELPRIAEELRRFVLNSVAATGGHLSSNLGTIELTVALHYVFDTPRDRLIWDAGHQTYAHKILTGRRAGMTSLRQRGGPSGFPRRAESEYDAFGTAHASTSISAALGMVVAARLRNERRHVIAVIGDGAMSAGMAFEALNNAKDENLLVVLNDNEMSISEPVGALNQYFARVLASRFYNSVREGGKQLLSIVPPVRDLARRVESHAKGMLLPGTLFEELGFNYIGPVDGHDVAQLVATLRRVRDLGGPQFLHVVTRKGAGYRRAEADPILYHGVSTFDPSVGIVSAMPPRRTFTQVFGDWARDMARADEHLVAITPAMRDASGLLEYSREFPTRYFDVGIAQQHALTFAAGLACEGMRPVVAIDSTFLQRGYDQLVHDVMLQDLPVMLAIDRAGIVGADGATHAGAFDVSFLRCLPNISILVPSDEGECRRLLTTAFRLPGPSAVRYPLGSGPGVVPDAGLDALPLGKAHVRRRASRVDNRVAILAFGPVLHAALAAAPMFDATVVDMRFVKPLDADLILALAQDHQAFVTVEENVVAGGAGAGVGELLAGAGVTMALLHLGLPAEAFDHGERALLLAQAGLDAAGIAQAIENRFPWAAGAPSAV